MPAPTIHVSDAAKREIQDGLSGTGRALRVVISPRFEYDLRADSRTDADIAIERDGVTILLDPDSASRADGMTIDFSTGPDVSGFSIANPNQPPRISQITALDLKALLDASEPFELVDVRTPDERAIAAIAGSHLLDQAYHDHLMSLDRDTPLVFQCHHGMRSQAAAEYFQQQGFRRLSNLQGGIDAWSQLVDASVPRY